MLALAAWTAAFVGAFVLLVAEFVELPAGVIIAAIATIGLGVVGVGVDAYLASRAHHRPWYRSLGRSLREAGAMLRDLLL